MLPKRFKLGKNVLRDKHLARSKILFFYIYFWGEHFVTYLVYMFEISIKFVIEKKPNITLFKKKLFPFQKEIQNPLKGKNGSK
jgi:hypothetical protein